MLEQGWCIWVTAASTPPPSAVPSSHTARPRHPPSPKPSTATPPPLLASRGCTRLIVVVVGKPIYGTQPKERW
ncbi:MAG: hypothetical protein OT477_14075 [Chloroflexi bacterium]|nr:hypothetical protein [Chloroflexota bacterium]